MIKNCKLYELGIKGDSKGKLIPLEYPKQLPFELRRVYYIYEVAEKERRGFHSHRDLEQILIAIHGKVKILVKTPFEEETVILDDPSKGLYIGPYVWREMFDFENDGTLLVLASHEYDESDYIRDYGTYEKEAKEYFGGKQ